MRSNESKRGKKLYYYLSRLDAKELKDFHAYLSSPLLGNSPQMARMLLVIQREVLGTGRKTIDADLFQEEFFPDQALDEGKCKYIRIRLVQMHSKLMDFAAFMEYKSDTNAQHVHLLKAMHTRGWEKYFERTYHEIEAMPPKKDFGEYHLYRMRREIVRNDHSTSKEAKLINTNLPECMLRIDSYIIFVSLKYACATIAAHLDGNVNIETRFDGLAIKHAEMHPFSNIPHIQAYAHIRQMLMSLLVDSIDGKFHFAMLKMIIAKQEGFDIGEIKDFFAFANNFCVFSIKRGDNSMVPELRALYNETTRAGIFSVGGMIERITFFSIVAQMCKLGEYDWSARFVDHWKGKIAADTDDLAYYTNRAYIHLVNQEYSKTIEILYNRVNLIDDPQLRGNARLFLWRAIWATGDYQWLLSNIEAQRVETSRNKRSPKDGKDVYKRFMTLFAKMCKAQLGNPDKAVAKLEKIRSSIEDNGETNRFFWLYRALKEELQRRNLS